MNVMQEIGILNRDVARVLATLGHMDELIVCDAGFPIPLGVETIDLALTENKPLVMELLVELKKYFSVEKMVMANETKEHSPAMFERIAKVFGENIPVETLPHTEFKQHSRTVKAILRTGDFTAYTNVLLISGAGNRWYVEKT
jgi:D-ribose pyranase